MRTHISNVILFVLLPFESKEMKKKENNSAKINNAVTCLLNSKEIICIISNWDKHRMRNRDTEEKKRLISYAKY